MARARRHKDVEFHVDTHSGTRVLNTFDEAASLAVSLAASNGRTVNIDVVVMSRSGAKWWAGEYGVEEYNADPEASVHERIAVKADSKGRIA